MKAKEFNRNNPDFPPSAGVIVIFCPGCKHNHYIHTKEKNSNGAMWTFNGDFERPTFSPSLHIWYAKTDENCVPLVPEQRHTVCHSFITDGMIQILADSDNELKGQTVPLPDIE